VTTEDDDEDEGVAIDEGLEELMEDGHEADEPTIVVAAAH
jgi:hypothetical protein